MENQGPDSSENFADRSLPDPSPPPLDDPKDRAWIGVAWLLLWHVVAGALTGGIGFFAFGLTQLVYGIPMAIHYSNKNRPRAHRGLMIAMAVGALLNGACAVAVFSSNGIFR